MRPRLRRSVPCVSARPGTACLPSLRCAPRLGVDPRPEKPASSPISSRVSSDPAHILQTTLLRRQGANSPRDCAAACLDSFAPEVSKASNPSLRLPVNERVCIY